MEKQTINASEFEARRELRQMHLAIGSKACEVLSRVGQTSGDRVRVEVILKVLRKKDFLQYDEDPVFLAGRDAMQELARRLKLFIDSHSDRWNLGSLTVANRVTLDLNQDEFAERFWDDPRGNEFFKLVQEKLTTLLAPFPLEGERINKGVEFGCDVYEQAVIDYTEPYLDKLLDLQAQGKEKFDKEEKGF